ncbi:lysyl oxidase homolog 3A-like [Branchiostoma floridae]|uniref:Lysyl oxidase homolog 3A-like n=1 Tax=Branchiostoma floridae TaxID=7739 RepID=A0A9J7N9L5_BRAFL|nr:lysyl oxidase homolog 3A-like [Branchiostoma floridae]
MQHQITGQTKKSAGLPSQSSGTDVTGNEFEFSCEPCRAGYKCVNGDEVEEPCEAGFYSRANATSCDPCSVGSHSETGSANCTGVRLRGGLTSREGRVEILHNDEWGTICNGTHVNYTFAKVVCTQLGYQNGSVLDIAFNSLWQIHFDISSDPIWLSNVQCSGEEDSLYECEHSGWGGHRCEHGGEASVICESREEALSSPMDSDAEDADIGSDYSYDTNFEDTRQRI